MGIDFKPQNALEQAIHDCNSEMVIYAIAENNMLTTLAPASNLGRECFSDEVIFSVLLNAVTEKQLHIMTNGWFWGHLRVGERLRKLVNETLAPLPQSPSEAEKKLIKAINYKYYFVFNTNLFSNSISLLCNISITFNKTPSFTFI